MSVELFAGDRADQSWSEPAPESDQDRERPNVSGDLPALFQAAPMFRRTVAGYDRFQVDTYVRWAEDELATADREREHLVARHLATRAALDEARELLSHTPSGGAFLQVSPRIASMLASAADEAESMRAEAAAERSAASADAAQMLERAEQAVADAVAEAARMLAEAGTQAEGIAADAARVVEAAEQMRQDVQVAAEARIEAARAVELRAAEQAELVRLQAIEDAAASQVRARAEIVRMLGTAREQRRRTDDEAAAARERLDREAEARRAFLLAEVRGLENQRSALLAQFALLARPVGTPAPSRMDVQVRRVLERLSSRSRSLRAP
jgi:cell division septum initiation protein DivIVA